VIHILIKEISRLTIVIALAVSICGCGLITDTITRDDDFKQIVPELELNTAIRLLISDQLTNEFTIGYSFDLLLENTSEHQVWFPQGYGLRVFSYSEDSKEWIELQNRVEYVSGIEDILDPHGKGNWLAVVSANPEITKSIEPVSVRILVVGEIFTGGRPTGEQVGAYIDVSLGTQ
jgi:hypothetical protein